MHPAIIIIIVIIIGGGDGGHRRNSSSSKYIRTAKPLLSEPFRAINTKNTNKIYVLIIPSTTAEGASIYRTDMTLPSPHFPTTSNLRRSESETVVYGNQCFSIRLERNDFTELILTELGSMPVSLYFYVFTFFL